jgi:transposase-like protein
MRDANETLNVLPVSSIPEPGLGKDLLTDVLRRGARELLAQAVEQEVQEWLNERAALMDERGRRLVVRNGHLPERAILTGIGPVEVRQPRVLDRRPPDERERFSSKILPPYWRKTKSLEELIPWLSLKGISTGDFQEALAALVGPECPGLSANTVMRLKSVWQDEYEAWSKRSLAGKEYVYVWVDGIYSNVRLEDDRVSPRRCNPKPRPSCTRSGWLRLAPRRSKPSTTSWRITRRSIPRPPTA